MGRSLLRARPQTAIIGKGLATGRTPREIMAVSNTGQDPSCREEAFSISDSMQQHLVSLQIRLERFYGLESAPSILPFIQPIARGAREELLVQQDNVGIAIRVRLPLEALEALDRGCEAEDLDALLEAVEGVSHFVHLSERARTELPTTLLELELQAEVDKFAFLATTGLWQHGEVQLYSRSHLAELHNRLFDKVSFLHPSNSVPGARYRTANYLAAKLWAGLLGRTQHLSVAGTLHRFYRAGQAEKIAIASAA